MRKTIFWPVLAGLALAPAAALCEEVDFRVDNFTFDGSIAEVVLAITNQTDRDMDVVFTDCAFLDAKKKAVNVGTSIVRNVPRRETVYDTASATASRPVKFAECRITRFEFAKP